MDLKFSSLRFLSLCSLNLDKQTVKGSTALHYCCLTDNSECLKLLLRGKASIEIGKKTHRQLRFSVREDKVLQSAAVVCKGLHFLSPKLVCV